MGCYGARSPRLLGAAEPAGAAHTTRRCSLRIADCLRQLGQPAADARYWAPERIGCARFAGGGAAATDSADGRRERAAVGCRRGRGPGSWAVGKPAATRPGETCSLAWTARADLSGRSCSSLHDVALFAVGDPVRPDARLASLAV